MHRKQISKLGRQKSSNREQVQDSFMRKLLNQLLSVNAFLQCSSQQLWLISFPAEGQALHPLRLLANNRAPPSTMLSECHIYCKEVPV